MKRMRVALFGGIGMMLLAFSLTACSSTPVAVPSTLPAGMTVMVMTSPPTSASATSAPAAGMTMTCGTVETTSMSCPSAAPVTVTTTSIPMIMNCNGVATTQASCPGVTTTVKVPAPITPKPKVVPGPPPPTNITVGKLKIAFPAGTTVSSVAPDGETFLNFADFRNMKGVVAPHLDDTSQLTADSFAQSEKIWFGSEHYQVAADLTLKPITYRDPTTGKMVKISLDSVFDVAKTGQVYMAHYYSNITTGRLVIFAVVSDPFGGSCEYQVTVPFFTVGATDDAAQMALDYDFVKLSQGISQALYANGNH